MAGPAEIPAVRRQVLGDEHNLLHPDRVDFVEDVGRRSGTAGGPGTTGWHRTRICGHSPQPPSHTPRAPMRLGEAG